MDRSRHLLIALLLSVSGCSTSAGLFSGGDNDPAVATEVTPTSVALAGYLEMMRDLVEGDPVTQAEVFQDTSQAMEWAPTTTNRLRFALALATPGHPSSDPQAALSLLNELLASTDTLLPDERILATIHLNEVDQRLVLNSESQRLKRDADNSLQRQAVETSQQLNAAIAENQKLQRQLREAEEKLEAITAIERSIQEREGNGDSP